MRAWSCRRRLARRSLDVGAEQATLASRGRTFLSPVKLAAIDIDGKLAFGLHIFEPRMQEIYKSWIRQILTTKSPYSGKTLAEETSVGVFEIQNEDSLFFWTFQPAALGKGPRELLEKKFGAWLASKYGSVELAFAAWPGDKHPDDDAGDSRAS